MALFSSDAPDIIKTPNKAGDDHSTGLFLRWSRRRSVEFLASEELRDVASAGRVR